MNFELFIILTVLTVVLWTIYNRDLLAPPVIVSLVFSFVAYESLFVDPNWDLHIGVETFWVLIVGILSISLGALLCRFFRLRRRSPYYYLGTDIEYIRIKNFKILFAISVVIFAISTVSIFKVAKSILGAGGLSSLIYAYRMNSLGGNNSLPGIVSNLILVNYAIGYIAIYIGINNWFYSNKIDRQLIWLILLPSLCGLMQGARGNLIQYLSFGIVIYYYFYLVKKKKKSIDVKFLSRIIMVLAIAVVVFYLLKNAIGRQNNALLLEYMGGLICAPLKLLDVYIKESHNPSSVWGMETFTNMISVIRRWQGLTGIKYGDYANYRVINNISFGNVYTAFRAYYADFRLGGVICCSALIGLFSGVFYERSRRTRKSGGIKYSLFIYAYTVYGLAMLFYSNTFYEYLANISFIKMLIVWAMIDMVFIKGKIKFKFGRS